MKTDSYVTIKASCGKVLHDALHVPVVRPLTPTVPVDGMRHVLRVDGPAALPVDVPEQGVQLRLLLPPPPFICTHALCIFL